VPSGVTGSIASGHIWKGWNREQFNKQHPFPVAVVTFWISTALFALQMGLTAYAQLQIPQVAATFAHLGFPRPFPHRTRVGQASRISRTAHPHGPRAAQGVGLRRLRHHTRLRTYRALRYRRWHREMDLGGGDCRFLGPVLLLLSSAPGRCRYPTATTLTLVVERVFPHPPEKLWRALTESSLLAQWMMKNDFEPMVGHRFQFRADPTSNWNYAVDCKVLVVDPPLRLSYIWSPSVLDGPQMVVLLTLTPIDGGTHLRMEQSGIPNEQGKTWADYSWQTYLGGLEKVLASLQ
jgi:uncharacterized protein YndB with AHSA1/START domain